MMTPHVKQRIIALWAEGHNATTVAAIILREENSFHTEDAVRSFIHQEQLLGNAIYRKGKYKPRKTQKEGVNI